MTSWASPYFPHFKLTPMDFVHNRIELFAGNVRFDRSMPEDGHSKIAYICWDFESGNEIIKENSDL
jgi:hypothetical protein